MPPEHQLKPSGVAFRISAQYVIIGALWILLSDLVVDWITDHASLKYILGTVKGWFYVIATGIMLFRLIYKPLKELKEYQVRLHRYAYRDALTGIPNRLALYEDFADYMTSTNGNPMGILYLDLDKFKYVNDSLGHSSGDELVREFANRLAERLSGQVRMYRLGGDEFVVWPQEWKGIEMLEALSFQVMDCVKEPFFLHGSRIYLTVSIGGAAFPEHGDGIEPLLRCGDIAMYQAKRAGGNTFVLFQHGMDEEYQNRMVLENELYTALDNREFKLVYQPQYDNRSRRVVGFEALLRWHHPRLGVVPPDRFIPIAEDTRLIIPIGDWVLRSACSFLSRLREHTGQPFAVSVNLSVLQLLQDRFTDLVEQVLADSGLPPEALELEITETVFMESLDEIKRKVMYLRGLGVRIALDDFGKGYSSLNSLMLLPISTIKVDKSFIDSICTDPRYTALTRNIIQIGRTFGLEVVAEGVETREQSLLLAAHDCHLIQGYLFSRPLPEEEVGSLPGLVPKD